MAIRLFDLYCFVSPFRKLVLSLIFGSTKFSKIDALIFALVFEVSLKDSEIVSFIFGSIWIMTFQNLTQTEAQI